MRYYVLENPSAGRRGGRAFVEGVSRALLDAGHEVTTYVGGEPGDLARHAATLEPDAFDVLLVAGGDGTLRSVLNASERLPTWPVGIIPVGTANLVARETRVLACRSPEALAAKLPHAETWRVDLLEVRRDGGPPERAISSVGVGLDGEMVHTVMEIRGSGERSGGYSKWVRPFLDTLRGYDFDDLELVLDGKKEVEAPLAVVQNARHYGGLFMLSPAAKLDSGKLDLVTVRARTRRDLLRLALRASTGRIHKDRQVTVHGVRTVAIRARQPVAVQADGDPAGHTDLEVTLRPGALQLLRVAR